METQFPRVNGAQLSANLGRSVIVIGEVVNNSTPHEVILRVSDGTQITVRLPMGEMVDSKFVQIMGKVDHGNTIDALRVTPVSGNFDMEMYGKALGLMNGPCNELFA